MNSSKKEPMNEAVCACVCVMIMITRTEEVLRKKGTNDRRKEGRKEGEEGGERGARVVQPHPNDRESSAFLRRYVWDCARVLLLCPLECLGARLNYCDKCPSSRLCWDSASLDLVVGLLLSTMGQKPSSSNSRAAAPTPPNIAPNIPAAGGYPGTIHPPRQSSTQMYQVTVPAGVHAGDNFAVLINGQRMVVKCPANASAGMQIHLRAPAPRSSGTSENLAANLMRHSNVRSHPPPPAGGGQRYRVVVPQGVLPGNNFAVIVNGQRMIVRCPPNVSPGQAVEIMVQNPLLGGNQNPSSRDLTIGGSGVNRTQRYRVRVPPNVRPGQAFRVNVGGNLFQVTCPPNSHAGAMLELELPALTQESMLADTAVTKLDAYAAENKKKAGDDTFSREVKDGKVVWVAKATAVDGAEGDDDLAVATAAPMKGLVRHLSDGGTISLVNAEEAVTDLNVQSWRGQFRLAPQELVNAETLPLSKKIAFFWSVLSDKMASPWDHGHVTITVRRDHILDDSLNAFQKLPPSDFHKIFRFKFTGEEGLDAGGLAREWFTCVAQQLFNPDFGLFSPSGVGGEVVEINPHSGLANEHHIQYFRMAGQFLGKALFDHMNVPIHLMLPLYKHILGMPVTVNDLEAIDYSLCDGLKKMKKLDDVSVVGEGFVVTEKIFGSTKQVELVPNGDDIDVTNDNFEQYLDCMVKYYLLERVGPQLSAFLKGFYEIIPPVLLSIFDFQELELVLCGLPDIDQDDWEKNTEYVGEYKRRKRSHKVIGWFWKLVREDKDFTDEDRARLLQFSTGTCRVPALGFGALQGRDGDIRHFTIDSVNLSDSIFPRAHTCFNRIELPLYKSYDEMKRRVKEAITMELTGFGME